MLRFTVLPPLVEIALAVAKPMRERPEAVRSF
jgi:hypothetical protein